MRSLRLSMGHPSSTLPSGHWLSHNRISLVIMHWRGAIEGLSCPCTHALGKRHYTANSNCVQASHRIWLGSQLISPSCTLSATNSAFLAIGLESSFLGGIPISGDFCRISLHLSSSNWMQNQFVVQSVNHEALHCFTRDISLRQPKACQDLSYHVRLLWICFSPLRTVSVSNSCPFWHVSHQLCLLADKNDFF